MAYFFFIIRTITQENPWLENFARKIDPKYRLRSWLSVSWYCYPPNNPVNGHQPDTSAYRTHDRDLTFRKVVRFWNAC